MKYNTVSFLFTGRRWRNVKNDEIKSSILL